MANPLTAAQLAVTLSVSVETLHEWAKAGRIPCYQVGRRRWFDLAEVLEAIKQPARTAPSLVPPAPLRGGEDHRLDAYYDLINSKQHRGAGTPGATRARGGGRK